MKKLVSLLLALAMLLSLAVAFAEDDHTVYFVFTKGGFEPDPEKNSIHEYINQVSGVTMNHIAPPAANYDEKLSILLASGSEDIDMFKLSKAQFNKMYDYTDQGALLDLASYLEEYMPHVLEIIPAEVLENMKVDGHLYGIPVYCSPNRMNCLIRQDWLDNLGLETPTALEELHDVLYAFTYNDPDGNGVNVKAFNNYWGYYYHWRTYESRVHKIIHEYDESFQLATLAPPTGADGTGAVRGVNSTNGVVCVMADSDNWEDCLRLIDWYHTEEGR